MLVEPDTFDIVVVGGGATGVGALLDASSRGLTCALVEADDIGSGTSSASSKLIHGGLRYLERGEVRLVSESLSERATLQRTASHLVKNLSFVIPTHSSSRIKGRAKLLGLSGVLYGYDLAGSLRSSKMHRMLSARESIEMMPTLRSEGLVGSNLYHDAFADDARLCLDVALTATEHFGAKVYTHASVVGFTPPDSSGLVEVQVQPDRNLSDQPGFSLRTRMVILAGGVGNKYLSEISTDSSDLDIVPAKGVHLAVHSKDLPLNSAGAIDVGDGRRIFVVPWADYSFFGTTDTPYHGDPSAPDIDRDDIDYLLGAINKVFDGGITRQKLTGGWSGLRPLLSAKNDSNSTTEISRKYEVLTLTPWSIVVAGGKLTTYRRMAQAAVDLACERLEYRRESMTKRVNLVGSYPLKTRDALVSRAAEELNSHLNYEEAVYHAKRLVERYGSKTTQVIASIDDFTVTATGDFLDEFRYQIEVEKARTVSDLLLRRSRIGILDFERALSVVDLAADTIQKLNNLSAEQVDAQVGAFSATIERLGSWRPRSGD